MVCQWVTAVEGAIPEGVWLALADAEADRGANQVFALDVAPDHSSASIAVAWKRPDGATHVMLADHLAGAEWFIARAQALSQTWGGRLVVESGGTAAFLAGPLERAGVTVDAVQRRFYVEACAALDAAVSARQLRHGNQDVLNAAVGAARWSTSRETRRTRRSPR